MANDCDYSNPQDTYALGRAQGRVSEREAILDLIEKHIDRSAFVGRVALRSLADAIKRDAHYK
jgi:hypothetical protein